MNPLLDAASFDIKHEYNVETVNVNKSDCLCSEVSSNGYIRKWYSNNSFIKLDTFGYSSVSEVVVSRLLGYTNIPREWLVQYRYVNVVENGKPLGIGCISKSFLNEGEQFFTIKKILRKNNLPLSITKEELLDVMLVKYDIDFKEYMSIMLNLDSVILNEDRHFGNFGIIQDSIGNMRFAPIFDNGDSLLSDTFTHLEDTTISEEIGNVYAKPFFTNFQKQVNPEYAIRIAFNKFLDEYNIVAPYEKRALKILELNAKRYEGKSWISI